jgi:hypothetical protein
MENNKEKLIFEQFILAKKDDFSTRSFPTSFAKPLLQLSIPQNKRMPL